MKDSVRCKFVEDFANSTSLAKGGHISVSYNEHCCGFTPEPGYPGFKCEDSYHLGHLIDGASAFMFWLARNNMKIIKDRGEQGTRRIK